MRTHPTGFAWRRSVAHAAVPVVMLVGGAVLLPAVITWPLYGLIAVAAMVGVLVLAATVGAERTSKVLLVAAFGFAPLGLLTLGSKFFLVADAAFFASLALAAPGLLRTRLRLPTVFVVGALFFIVMGFLASLLAADPLGSFRYLLLAIIALIAMPVLVAWMAPDDRWMFAMALAFGVGTAVSTLIGLPRNEYRNYGFTYHPVALGYTAMLTLSLVPFLLNSKVRSRWILVPPVALVALVGVWTSGSRTGLIVLVALAVLVPVLERSLWFGLSVAAAATVLLPRFFTYDASADPTSALSRLQGSGGAQGSDSVRLDTLRIGLEQVRESPVLGNGYSIENTYVIHNLYLQVLAAEGLIGLIGILLILGLLVIPLLRGSSPRRYLAYPAVAVILAGPFQPNMTDHYLALVLGLSLIGAISSLGGDTGSTERSGDPPDAADQVGPSPRSVPHTLA